jgi:ribokinase
MAVKVAVVGHVEWVEFARVPHLPHAGEILEARDLLHEPAGGGAVAAVQLARLAGGALLIAALGDDALAGASEARLRELGVDVHARRDQRQPTRRALTLVDEREHERTIVTLGERLEPRGGDSRLPWGRLGEMDAVYFTAGDLAALRHARAARVLVASPRAGSVLGHGVPLDALVLSRSDAHEREGAARWQDAAALVVRTEGARGGTWWRGQDAAGGSSSQSTWAAAEPPGPPVDSYGCGDSFAAGLAYALALGWPPARALALAARCGATCLTGRGPYQRQLGRAELGPAELSRAKPGCAEPAPADLSRAERPS